MSGQLVIDTAYIHVGPFSEGLAKVNVGTGDAHDSIAEACEEGFIDSSGNFLIAPQFFSAGRFRFGRCIVTTERSIGYIDRSGNFIWKSNWVEVLTFDPHHLLPDEVLEKEGPQ